MVADNQRWRGIHRWTRGVHRTMPPGAHAVFLAIGLAAAAASSALFLTGVGTGGSRPTTVLPGICQYCDPPSATDGLFAASPPPTSSPSPRRPATTARAKVQPAPVRHPSASPSMSVCKTPWPSPSKSKKK
jgi:hypothetical protein